MPKIIKNPEDRILQAARKRLLDKDLSSFSLRDVAADCGIAVGTIYNYFKDKESLMAAVMIQDWVDALETTRGELAQTRSLQEGLLYICRGIRSFSACSIRKSGDHIPRAASSVCATASATNCFCPRSLR